MLEVIDKGSSTDSHPVPLLFVHGGNLAAWCWDEHFLDFFADSRFSCRRGQPARPWCEHPVQPLNSCSIADYVDDVRATVDMLGAKSMLIGHSMGCTVVQKYLESAMPPLRSLWHPCTPQGIRRITFACSAVIHGSC